MHPSGRHERFYEQGVVPGKLKPAYALMNKIIHNMIEPKGKEKLQSKEEIHFLYEVMTGKIFDYALVIWCVMRDFLQSPTENRHIPFPTLVTNLVEAAGMKGVVREKNSFEAGAHHEPNRSKKLSCVYKASVFSCSFGDFWGLFVLSSGVDEHFSFEKDGAQDQGLV